HGDVGDIHPDPGGAPLGLEVEVARDGEVVGRALAGAGRAAERTAARGAAPLAATFAGAGRAAQAAERTSGLGGVRVEPRRARRDRLQGVDGDAGGDVVVRVQGEWLLLLLHHAHEAEHAARNAGAAAGEPGGAAAGRSHRGAAHEPAAWRAATRRA